MVDVQGFFVPKIWHLVHKALTAQVHAASNLKTFQFKFLNSVVASLVSSTFCLAMTYNNISVLLSKHLFQLFIIFVLNNYLTI